MMSVTSEFSRILQTAEETLALATRIADFCKIGDCLLLYGDLGAGKTTFARGFIQAKTGTKEEIVSPTFTLVQIYPIASGGAVWHCDLYRLKNSNELLELGLDEAFEGNITLIEWPEIAASQLPQNSLNIRLEMEGEGRKITISGNADIIEKLNNL